MKNQFFPLTLKAGMLVIASLSLTACFGSSSSDEPKQAVADSFDVVGNGPHTLDVLANDEGNGLTIAEVVSPDFGDVEIDDGVLVYTPTTDFVGTATFSYTIGGDAKEDTAAVEVNVAQSVGLQGRVIDAPIANATITISFGGENSQTFTTEADEEGRYELPLIISNLDDDELIRLTARGSAEHGQEFVTLSSRLLTVSELLSLVGGGNTVTRDTLEPVQVTQLTTARDFLVTRAANGERVTSSNVGRLENVIDPDLMLEMAAVIKLMVDDPDFSLPEGKSTLDELLNDAESYNQVVTKASEGGENSPLARAIEATLSDPEIMPRASVQLDGDYLVMFDTAPFMVNRSGMNIRFNGDGTARRTTGALDGTNHPGRFSYVDFEWSLQDGRVSFIGDEISMAELGFPIYQFIADEATKAAYKAKYGEGYPSTTVTRKTYLRSFQIVSTSDRDIVVRQEFEYEWERPEHQLTFVYEGETYYADLVDGPLTQSYVTNSRLVKADHLKRSDIKFENVSAQPWILTDLYGYTTRKSMFDLNPDGTATLAMDEHYYHYASFYYLQNQGWKANWALHDNDTRLRVTLRDNNDNLITHTDFFWNRKDEAALGLVTEYSNDHGETYASVDQGGPVPAADVDVADIVEQLDSSNMLASAVNKPATAYEGTSLKPSDWFGWTLGSDGTGQSPILFCDGEDISLNELCEGEFSVEEPPYFPVTWELAGGTIQIERADEVDRSHNCDPASQYYTETTPCNRRVIIPLRQAESGIVFGVEYNVASTSSSGIHLEEQRPFYQVEPRFMSWTIESLPSPYIFEPVDFGMSSALMDVESTNTQPFTADYKSAFPSSHNEEYDGYQ